MDLGGRWPWTLAACTDQVTQTAPASPSSPAAISVTTWDLQAQTALEEARLKLQRRRNLASRDTISREVLDNSQLAVDAATAGYQQALALQQLAERELADTRIVSPTDGLVDVKSVEPGEPVLAGASLVKLQAVAGLRVQTWGWPPPFACYRYLPPW